MMWYSVCVSNKLSFYGHGKCLQKVFRSKLVKSTRSKILENRFSSKVGWLVAPGVKVSAINHNVSMIVGSDLLKHDCSLFPASVPPMMWDTFVVTKIDILPCYCSTNWVSGTSVLWWLLGLMRNLWCSQRNNTFTHCVIDLWLITFYRVVFSA